MQFLSVHHTIQNQLTMSGNYKCSISFRGHIVVDNNVLHEQFSTTGNCTHKKVASLLMSPKYVPYMGQLSYKLQHSDNTMTVP